MSGVLPSPGSGTALSGVGGEEEEVQPRTRERRMMRMCGAVATGVPVASPRKLARSRGWPVRSTGHRPPERTTVRYNRTVNPTLRHGVAHVPVQSLVAQVEA